MNLSLAGKVLVVTGSTQGVGRAVALEAAGNGAEAVLVTGRDEARGRYRFLGDGERNQEASEALGVTAGEAEPPPKLTDLSDLSDLSDWCLLLGALLSMMDAEGIAASAIHRQARPSPKA